MTTVTEASRMIYDYPEFYELAFAFRDITAETEFLRRVMHSYLPTPARSVLEIASGPATHAGQLIESGLHYVGLDNNRAMIEYAAGKWQHLGRPPRFVEADMASFELNNPVEFAFVLLGSLYLNTPERIESHFDSMAGALRRGGLYLLDLCVEYADPMQRNHDRLVITHHNGVTVESKFDIALIDKNRRLYEERWQVAINRDGERAEFETVERNMAWFAGEFESFIRSRNDFELVGSWAAWDFEQPIIPGLPPERPCSLLRRI